MGSSTFLAIATITSIGLASLPGRVDFVSPEVVAEGPTSDARPALMAPHFEELARPEFRPSVVDGGSMGKSSREAALDSSGRSPSRADAPGHRVREFVRQGLRGQDLAEAIRGSR